MDIRDQKKEIRRAIRELKRCVDMEWMLLASDSIMSQLESQDLFKAAETVLLYHALPDEVQTANFLERWYGKKRLVLPLVVGDDLVLKEFSPDKIVPGYKGIPEPSSDAVTVDPDDVQLAVIPGVAFDSMCNRLGRGKGFYDRLIPHLKCPLTGLGFDFQMVDEVPVEIFDRKLDMVITQSTLFYRE